MPWADLLLFAVIGGVLALWWLRPPAMPTPQTIAQVDRQSSLLAQPQATLAAGLFLDDTRGSSDEPVAATPTPVPSPTATPQPTPTATTLAAPIRYTVKSGDTVSAIAAAHGSTSKDIIQANGLGANGQLRVGQELIVPVAGPMGGPGLAPTATVTGGTLIYTVQAGDTVSDIAIRLKSQIDWILTANHMQPTDYLRIGQTLLVPLSHATATPTVAVIETPQTPTTTPEPGFDAPALLAPPDGSLVTAQDGVVLSWTSVGVLKADAWYVVTLRVGERLRAPVLWWTKGTTWRLPTTYRGSSLAGVDFQWQVQVRTGSASLPGEVISPPSVERRFTWR